MPDLTAHVSTCSPLVHVGAPAGETTPVIRKRRSLTARASELSVFLIFPEVGVVHFLVRGRVHARVLLLFFCLSRTNDAAATFSDAELCHHNPHNEWVNVGCGWVRWA